jgi:multiple sugar transport system ATP-binding protein
MNLVEARIDARNGKLTASFGGQELTIPDEVTTRRSTLRDYVGRQIALGIRPHTVEDAAIAGGDEGRRLRGRVQLTEALGSELVAYVAMPGKPVEHEAVIEGAVYEESEQVAVQDISVGQREGETSLVASLDPSSRAREGEDLELTVDTLRLHFFDLESASAIDGRA